MRTRLFPNCILRCSIFVALLWGSSAPSATSSIQFEKQIEPIFREHCYTCHGPEKQKNGLRLDRRENALAGGDDGRDIVPGKSSESRLIRYVSGGDPEKIMPPKGERLNEKQITLLRTWIDQGANWPTAATSGGSSNKIHWAFVPPQHSAVPRVRNAKWIRNPIDAFILARLEREGIRPSPEADRTTLIRRLSLDLTGLPPRPDEITAFVADKSPAAYEKVVDRLLASPHFGEQWARHWLDLARYADSDGYEKDFYRPHAWRWRNWVIDSINRDQPFDQFTREQIAGDLIPNASVEQRVATGFNRNNLLNREGGVDIEEDRCKIVVDRVSTLGTAWLGLTVGCAECHSHKYDPISQREFYQLYAFFNSTDDRDIKAPVAGDGPALRRQESDLEKARRSYVEGDDAELDHWARGAAALPDVWVTPKVEDYDLPTFGANNGANLYPQEDGSFLVTGMIENKTHYIMMLNTKLKGITGIRVEAMTDEMLPRLGPGWARNGSFVLTELQVESASLKRVNDLRTNQLAAAYADYSQPGFPVAAAIDGITTNGGWAVDLPHLPMAGLDRCAVFVTREDVGYGDDDMRLKVSLVQNEGRSHTLGRVRVTYTTANRETLATQIVPQRIRDIARVPREKRTLLEQANLKHYFDSTFRTNSPQLAAFAKALAESPGIKGEVQAQVLAERSILRPTHVHVRGNFLDHGSEVERGTLPVLPPLKPRGALPDRLDLANWIVRPANPLTARVAVNHIWQQLFGEGLVATAGDFGSQGEKPSHPELLDWLATEFMARHWSRKEIIRLILTSAVYRQSSDTRTDLLNRDARNCWLARQNRFRLPAESARDQFLAAGGILDETIGGPSVSSDTKRRGMYLQIKRANIDYLLTTFDAPLTTQSCPRRERSNTPLQSLTLLNDKLFVESARTLGSRLATTAGADADRIVLGFELCLARRPDKVEQTKLRTLLQELKNKYEQNSDDAGKIVGKSGSDNVAELAAWIVLARTILNLDEVITRD